MKEGTDNEYPSLC